MFLRRSKPAVIRRAVAADAPAILKVHLASLRQLCEADYAGTGLWEWAVSRTADGYASAIAGRHFMVAEMRREIVGFADFDGAAGEIIALYVDPAQAGKGIGTRLLREIEEHAGERGLRELNLLAAISAVPFYQRFGFIAEEAVNHDPGHGIPVPCVPMRK